MQAEPAPGETAKVSCASSRGDAAPLPPSTPAARLAEALANYRNAGGSKRERERRDRDIIFLVATQIGGVSRRRAARALRCRQGVSRDLVAKLRQHAAAGAQATADE